MEQTTVRDCAALCDADESCLSFEYEHDGPSSCSSFDMMVDDSSHSFNWYLKGGVSIAEADGELPVDMPTSNALIMGISVLKVVLCMFISFLV